MQYYLAPMQSLTGFVFRNAYNQHFHNIDKYFTPFLSDKRLSNKDKNEILPEHNNGMTVVPQIMTNRSDIFLEITKQLEDYGYTSVNLNLGCPSGTVVPKKRGAGLLSDLNLLTNLLDDIFEKCPLHISIKTRIGIDSPTEWEELQTIYNQYPIEELIIHARLQQDQYKNHPNLDVYAQAVKNIKCPVCYNGDIHSVTQYNTFIKKFPETDTIMIGRGALKNPGLIGEINGEAPITKEKLLTFHNDIFDGYKEFISGDTNVLYKMKELWVYLGESYHCENSKKIIKKIMKSKSLSEYHTLARHLITECDIAN